MVTIRNRYTGAVIDTLPGSNLAGVVVGGRQWTEADLTGLDCTGANFDGVNLTNALFAGAILTDATFRRANLERADLSTATLGNTDFLPCYKQGALIPFPNPKPVHVIYMGGQSNMVGVSAAIVPSGVPLAAVRYYLNVIGTVDTAGFVDLKVVPPLTTCGGELFFGKNLFDAGYDLAILKLAQGATTMSDWVPGGANFTALRASYLNGISLLNPAYGVGRNYVFHGNWWLGEDDVRFSGGAGIPPWANNFRLFAAGMATICAQEIKWHVTLTQNWIANPVPNGLNAIRYAQQSVASYTMNVDGLPANPDNVHVTSQGEADYGVILYNSFLQEVT